MPTEGNLIEEMKSMLKAFMTSYKEGETRRDGHPKCLGLMKGQFQILDNIPQDLKVGIFKKPRTFKCWIRSSSANTIIQTDAKKDFRGLALKLLDVEGERYDNDNSEKHTQDLLLLSYPVMPLGTVQIFRNSIYYLVKKKSPLGLGWNFLKTGNIGILATLFKAMKNQSSPLDINYWSTTPYQLNDLKVKYHIKPTSSYKSTLPNKKSENYLTDNMQKHLNTSEASFDFYVQRFKNEKATPIENAGKEWKEKNSPFTKVGRLTIPMQDFNTENRNYLAEQFSFSPAHALKVHQPIGGLNRARIAIYKYLSDFRHNRDNRPRVEPLLKDYDVTP